MKGKLRKLTLPTILGGVPGGEPGRRATDDWPGGNRNSRAWLVPKRDLFWLS